MAKDFRLPETSTAYDLEDALYPPAVSVSKSATQSIAQSTFTAVTFNNEDYDTHDMHDTASNTSRLTAPSSGVYHIWGSVDWANAVFPRAITRIRLNGATYIFTTENWTSSSPPFLAQPVARDYSLSRGDYVELIVWHNHATAAQNINAATLTFFGMHWLRPIP